MTIPRGVCGVDLRLLRADILTYSNGLSKVPERSQICTDSGGKLLHIKSIALATIISARVNLRGIAANESLAHWGSVSNLIVVGIVSSTTDSQSQITAWEVPKGVITRAISLHKRLWASASGRRTASCILEDTAVQPAGNV